MFERRPLTMKLDRHWPAPMTLHGHLPHGVRDIGSFSFPFSFFIFFSLPPDSQYLSTRSVKPPRPNPFAIRHSPCALRHSPCALRRSPFAIYDLREVSQDREARKMRNGAVGHWMGVFVQHHGQVLPDIRYTEVLAVQRAQTESASILFTSLLRNSERLPCTDIDHGTLATQP